MADDEELDPISNAEDEELDPISDEQWNAIRDTLKAGILAGEIPVDTKALPPKALYERFLNSNGRNGQVRRYEVATEGQSI